MPDSFRQSVFQPAVAVACCLAILPVSALAQDVRALVREGTQLEREGRFDESLALFEDAVAAGPSSFEARYALGRSLDLAGRYAEAREHLRIALKLAAPSARDMVLSALAVSHAFEGNARDAATYYTRQFDTQTAAGQPATAAATANALARVYLETGQVDEAEKWYRTGFETGLMAVGLTPAQRDLWEFRWQSAAGRIAARRGRVAEARAAAAEAKAVVDRGTNPDQVPYLPYLTGYIEFFAGNYRKAIDALSTGNLDDPFVAGLVARAYEKLGDRARAREYYERVMASNAHSINAAFSRPLARAFLR
jgi:tetratricopeptide (TPR) repeat protein